MYRFAINRPITTLMGVMSFIVFGLISFKTMPVDLYPNIDFPVVTVQTSFYGADPESVESKVTDKIEEALSGIDGIDKLTSTSYAGLSSVVVQFKLTKDINEAVNDVRDKIGSASLPSDVEKPIVKKLGTSGAVINLFIASKSGDMASLMRLADEKIKPKLQRILNVGEVNIVGYRDREIKITFDPFMLNKYRISASQLQNIISSENLKAGGGKVKNSDFEYIIKSEGDAKSIEALKNISILPGVLLKEIATIEDSLQDADSYASLDGVQGVNIEVKKISGKNSLEVIEGVKKVYPDLVKLAGEEYTLTLVQDKSEKIMVNIDNVTFDLIYGAILAVLIVFAFLRNLTATIVSALAIPTSIIGTFAIIDWLGYDLNRLTLIGLTLAIGIFIDDAIVVIENITKKLEHGMESFQASFEGIKEIAFSILAISAVLLAVFVPVAFMDGIVGKFFNSFAMTVASGVVISYFVAVMLVPSVAARVLSAKESRFYRATEPFFVAFDTFYVRVLRTLLKNKVITILGIIALLYGTSVIVKYVGGDFVPMEDNSEFQIYVKAPLGTSLEKSREYVAPIIGLLNEDTNILTKVVSIGYDAAKEVNKVKIYCKLVPVAQREEKQEEIVQRYRDAVAKLGLDMLTISIEEVPPFETGESNAPVQIVITGGDFKEIEAISQKFVTLLSSIQGAVNIDTDYELGKPEIVVTLKRENAKRLGVSSSEIASLLNAAFSSERGISNFEDEGKQFDITLRLKDAFRENIDDLKRLQIQGANGESISLEGLVEIEESEGVASIRRFNRERKIMVTANLYAQTLDEVVRVVEEQGDSLLQEGYTYRFVGDIERMAETNAAFAAAVGLATVLIYLILAALYESLLQPFIIMISMPLSFVGVVTALFLSGKPFSLFVMIGVILLLGMVGKNAILVVDFANKAIKEGKDVESALLEAGEKRLRPILMTSSAMIFAMIPLAFGGGAGAEGNSPMALAIIGGLISSTLLTLLAVPVFYRILYPLDARLRRLYERELI